MSILYRGDLRDHLNEGLYTVRMDKHRATWHYFTTNPQGGGFGSNHCGTKRVALAYALRSVASGTEYRLIVNGKDCGLQRKGVSA